MPDLEIDTDEMKNVNKKLASLLDNLPEKLEYTEVSVNESSELNNRKGLNTNVSDSIQDVNGKIDTIKSDVQTLLQTSNNYINKIEEANTKGLEPSELEELPASIDDIKVPSDLDYDKSDGSSRYNYGGSLLGSMNLNNRIIGTPQGFTQAFSGDNSYYVVSSYTGDNAYIQVFDSQTGKLVVSRALGGKSHVGGVTYIDGNLVIADNGITAFKFDDLLNRDDIFTNSTLYKHVTVGATGNNSNGGASFIGRDEAGNIIVGSFHSQAGNFDHENNSTLLLYHIDSNGNIVQNVGSDGKPITMDAISSQGRPKLTMSIIENVVEDDKKKNKKNNKKEEEIPEVITKKVLDRSNQYIEGFTELQGVCTQTIFGQEQAIFTSSYFANDPAANSTLLMANYDINSNFTEDKIIFEDKRLPRGAEQVVRLADGNFAIIYEPNGQYRVDFVSADYFMRSNDPNYNEWKTNNWKSYETKEL